MRLGKKSFLCSYPIPFANRKGTLRSLLSKVMAKAAGDTRAGGKGVIHLFMGLNYFQERSGEPPGKEAFCLPGLVIICLERAHTSHFTIILLLQLLGK